MVLIIRLLRKLKLLRLFNLSARVHLRNERFVVPVMNGVGIDNLFMSELWMMDIIKIAAMLKPGAFIDVGVNVGQTLLKIKAVDKNASYLGFEPNPTCVNYIEELIKRNTFSNTTIIPVGISNKTELLKLNFYTDSATDSSASLDENFRPQQRFLLRKIVQVSDRSVFGSFVPEKISAIKIDVEGFELFVIQAMDEVIAVKRPIIILEILPVYSPENNERLIRQNAIEDFFKENNYRIFLITKDVHGKLDGLVLREPIGIHADLKACDYLVVPAEMVNDLRMMVTTQR